MSPKIDDFLRKVKRFPKELEKLRAILLDCQLTEALKWRQRCYAFQDNNIAIIGEFKEYCALSFFKGVLLNDTNKILVSPGENSQSVKMIKFTSLKEIIELEDTLKTYIYEAIEVEKAGLKVPLKKILNLCL